MRLEKLITIYNDIKIKTKNFNEKSFNDWKKIKDNSNIVEKFIYISYLIININIKI